MDRLSRALALVGCWAMVGAMAAGCGQSKPQTSDQEGASGAALHVLSTPVTYAEVGQDLKYQAVLSKPGAADWVLTAAPQGATIDQSGTLSWTPTADQSGPQTIAMNAVLAGEQVTQTVHVTAASSVVQASAHVDPASVNGALIAVDAPLSPIQGAAVQLQPGALPPGPSVAVTIASMTNAPTPMAAQVAGVPPSELRPVDFGPSGMAFEVPVQVHLPVRPAVLQKGRPEIQTYDYDRGVWQKIKVISVDEANGFVVGEIQHFSTYVVTPPSQAFDLGLGLGAAGSACAQALLVRPTLAAAFDQIPAAAVNGYGGTGTTLGGVLAGLAKGQAMQVYTRVRAQAAAATGEQTGWVLASATRLGDGKLKVNVTTDSHGGGFLTTPPELDSGDSEVAAWLSGGRVDLIFAGLGAPGAGATADAEVSFYAVPASDADRPPPAAANAFAAEETTQPALAPMNGVDDDCDGAPNQWDPTPQGTPPPQLAGLPVGAVHVAVGSAASFKVSAASAAGVTFAWTASDPSVAMTTTNAGAGAAATPAQAGHFTVDAVATNGGSSSRLHWDLIADPEAVRAANTPPVVAIGASAVSVRAGERVVLAAFGKDAEQSDLTFSWSADDARTLSAQTGSSITFAAATPGDYKIGCTASDGIAGSTPAAVVISVLSPMANRPPTAPLVTPISVVLQHAAGAAVSLALSASAADPDGDALTYDFVPDRFTPPTFTLTKNGPSAMFATAQDGLYLFYVTAKDSHGATSAWTPAKIQVLPTLPATPVDADKDGYPAGIDCNDNDPTVHPGAVEICGDGIDQSCDGHDLAAADCDADGDRFTINQGDCDDHNPAVNPGAAERCDGIDNNCNGLTDEGFGVGVGCTAGVGGCRVAATTTCNAAHNGVVCGGNPGLPKPEVCDGVDNDCDGQIDDVTASASGDVTSCGGCSIHCPVPANSVAACVKGGCSAACAPGWIDTDHNPDNGCECQVTNGGVEICDGLDNDCNGSVDDGASAIFYDGPTGTLGTGVCASGTRLCMAGKLVVVRAQQVPAPEVCDGLDNDCNGVVDDGFDFTKDPRNCGACGIACASGVCQGGKCAGSLGGAGGAGGTGVGGAGGVTGADAGVRDGGGADGSAGVGGSVMAICPGATGSICTDLGFDAANCGACGHACPSGMFCSGGVCQAGPAGTDGSTAGADNPDAGAGTVPPTCDASKPKACQNAAGAWSCVDPGSDAANCGGCGRACPSGATCAGGLCAGGAAACASPLSSCGSACTTLADDPANCGSCGKTCQGGVCGVAICQPPGAGKYGDPCQANTNCAAGMMCMDEARFGWANGFCTTPCGANSPCAAGQACVDVGGKLGGFGLCQSKCTADADCARGYLCGSGLCAPDCRSSTKICLDGQACDSTGRCVAGAAGTTPGLAACPGTNGAPVCTNLYFDGANCGACGTICGGGTYCQSGVCVSDASACPAPGKICVDQPSGKTYCASVDVDPGNCGFCGNVCPASTACQSGVCTGVDGGASASADAAAPTCPDPMTKMCPVAGGYYCALVMNDPANCGGCGNVCPQSSFCQNSVCTPVATDGGAGACTDPDASMCPVAGGGSFCTNLTKDPGNCGTCGYACPAGQSCVNATCLASDGSDGGVTAFEAGAL